MQCLWDEHFKLLQSVYLEWYDHVAIKIENLEERLVLILNLFRVKRHFRSITAEVIFKAESEKKSIYGVSFEKLKQSRTKTWD